MYPPSKTVMELVKTLKLYLTYESTDGRMERRGLRKELGAHLLQYEEENKVREGEAETDALNGK